MNVIDKLYQLEPILRQTETDKVQAIIEATKTSNDLDELILHHSISQADAARMCGISLNTFKERVKEAIDAKVIDDVLKINNKYFYSLWHMHALMDWMQLPKWRDNHQHPIVVNVQNQKGGVGKTTTVISMAAGIALRMNERRRVLVIDLDPQGSHQQITAPYVINSESIVLSAVDLMLGSDEQDSTYQQLIEDGYTHQQLLEYSILKTHIPNLEILSAFPSDERFSQAAWSEFAKTGSMNHVNLLKTKIVEPLLDKYDLIIIDTGPQINPLTWSASEACNALLVPVSTRKLDWLSTSQFLVNLPYHLTALPSKGENIKYFKVVTVNYDEEQNRDIDMLNHIKSVLGREVLNSTIKRSSAFEAASRNYRTVFDIRKKENLCPDRQLDRAIASLNDTIRELLLTFEDIMF